MNGYVPAPSTTTLTCQDLPFADRRQTSTETGTGTETEEVTLTVIVCLPYAGILPLLRLTVAHGVFSTRSTTLACQCTLTLLPLLLSVIVGEGGR